MFTIIKRIIQLKSLNYVLKKLFTIRNRSSDVLSELEKLIENTSTTEIKGSLNNPFENSDFNINAYLNWGFDKLTTQSVKFANMSDAYFFTSIESLRNILSKDNTNEVDLSVFPILFNTVHGIELSMKSILLQQEIIRKYGSQTRELEGLDIKTHNIRRLSENVMNNFENQDYNYLWNLQEKTAFIEKMDFLLTFINYLYEKTEDMSFMRYPEDNRGNSYFYSQEYENVKIDLVMYFIWVYKIHEISKDIFDNLYDEIEILESM